MIKLPVLDPNTWVLIPVPLLAYTPISQSPSSPLAKQRQEEAARLEAEAGDSGRAGFQSPITHMIWESWASASSLQVPQFPQL